MLRGEVGFCLCNFCALLFVALLQHKTTTTNEKQQLLTCAPGRFFLCAAPVAAALLHLEVSQAATPAAPERVPVAAVAVINACVEGFCLRFGG